MFTYLDGVLVAFWGEIPAPWIDLDPRQPAIFSGEREPIRRPNSKTGSVQIVQVGSKLIFRPIAPLKSESHGRFEHRHIHVKHIRATKGTIKRLSEKETK